MTPFLLSRSSSDDSPGEERVRRYHLIHYGLFFFTLAELAVVLLVLQLGGVSAHLEDGLKGWSHGKSWLTILLYILVFHAFLYFVQLPQHFFKAFLLERRYGLSKETFGQWCRDEIKANLVSALLLVLFVEFFFAMAHAQPDHGWIAVSLFWMISAVFLTRILPRVILPMFYPMKPLPEGDLKQRLVKLAGRIGVSSGSIYEIGLSRKTQRANAAVVGIGKGKRIVLGDTLTERFSPEEIEVILGHELAHFEKNHVVQHITFDFALVTMGFFLLFKNAAIFPKWFGGAGLDDLSIYPMLVFFLGLFSVLCLPFRNGFSRRLEKEADYFALKLTGSRRFFISAMEKLASQNLALKRPPRFIEMVFYSHPSISRRISMAQGTVQTP